MQLLPKLRTKFGENIGVELFISHPDLETEFTVLNTDASAGASSLTVDNGLKFADTEYLLVGRFGGETTEIVQISGSPNATTLPLSGTTNYAHNRGVLVQTIPYNRVVIEYSTDGTTYSALTTVNIRPDTTETYYNDTSGLSTYYYRVKFSNSTTSGVSSYSDGVIATGDAENSAGAIIRDALVSLGEKLDDKVLTKEFLLRALDEGRDEIDLHVNAGRWAFRTVFDYDLGDCIPGRYSLTLPTDLRNSNTAEHILSVRVGRDKLPAEYMDKVEFNSWYQGVAHTTLNGSITTADTSIILTSSGDFDESGSVDIAAEDITGTVDNVDYETNTETTGTLGTVTNIGENHASGRDVWQGVSFGYPIGYTVDNGTLYFAQPFDDDLAGENIWIDYYQKKTVANSFGDTLDETFYPIYKPYIRYRIKLRKNPSMNIEADPDYITWVQKREAQVLKEFGGQEMRLSIDIPA